MAGRSSLGTGALKLARWVCALLAVVAGLLTVAVLFRDAPWSWLLVILAGVAGGAVAGKPHDAWIALLAVAVEYPIAVALAMTPANDPLWYVDLLGAAVLAFVGFIPGTAIGWRGDRVAASAAQWRAIPRRARLLIVVCLVGFALLPVFYGGVIALIAVDKWTADPNTDCRTPLFAYGWAYEAINYDQATDAALQPRQTPDPSGQPVWTCDGTRAPAGAEVVTSDGVRIAGWYVPAGSGIGADGPTIVIVPGGKSNKSEMLKYAPPVHESYNLVLLDNRGMGQSGAGQLAMGALEQLDVRAVIDWLERTRHPSWVAALGNSMGAAAALAEAADDMRVRALVLDSMHANAVVTIGNILETEEHLPAVPAAWAIVALTSWRLGVDVAAVDPVSTITRLGDRPVLLIHGTADAIDRPEQSADLNLHAALAAGVRAELDYCQGGTHGGLVDNPDCAADWSRWANSFLEAARNR